jgi:uncharacterized repeat protein (TIGR01451 family)
MRAFIIWISTLLAFCLSYPVFAVDYVNTLDDPINNGTACGTNDLVKTFSVPDSFIINDVNLGIQLNHTWRGDINARLVSPSGTIVQIITPDTGADGNIDNYNILLDDNATTPINVAPHDTPDGTVAPPYENLVRPSNPLSSFNGENSQGNWELRICDSFPGADDGTFNISTLSLIPVPSPPPSLTCSPAEQSAFVWDPPGDTNGWAPATLNNSYIVGQTPMDITVTGDTQFLIPRNGVATPVTSTEFTGGGPVQNSVAFYADFPSQANSLTVTMALGTPNVGVESVTFNIFDVDRGGWIDRITATGSLGGVSVPVTLTGSPSNIVTGNQAVGTAGEPGTSGDANVNLIIVNQVDTITITYDNDPAVQANPAPQIMSFFADLSLCPLPNADLTAVKSVEVFDPGNAGLYMTPGNEILYRITVNNSAAATAAANDINISDTLPDNLTFLSATTTGFTGGSFGSPDLPSANTDCTGGNCVISFAGGSLAQDSTGEIVVRAIIQ